MDSSSDWIKIKYDDKEAYIYSEFVEIVPMFLNDMGEYEEYVEFDSVLPEYFTKTLNYL